jgi:hypothetical protein
MDMMYPHAIEALPIQPTIHCLQLCIFKMLSKPEVTEDILWALKSAENSSTRQLWRLVGWICAVALWHITLPYPLTTFHLGVK